MQLDAVKRAFDRGWREISKRGAVLIRGVLITLFQLSNLSAHSVQTVVVGVETLSAREKRVGLGDGAGGDLRPRGGNLEGEVAGHGVGGLRVGGGGIVEFAVELVGIGELGGDVGFGAVNGLKRGNCLRILADFAVIAGEGALHVRIVGRAMPGHVEIAAGQIHLLKLLIREREQQLRARVGLQALRLVEPVDGTGVVL
jgi:hypothetical protein